MLLVGAGVTLTKVELLAEPPRPSRIWTVIAM